MKKKYDKPKKYFGFSNKNSIFVKKFNNRCFLFLKYQI